MFDFFNIIRDTLFYKLLYAFCIVYLDGLLFVKYYNELKRSGQSAWKCLMVLAIGIWLIGDIIFSI